MKITGELLKSERIKLKLTQQDVAFALKLSPRTINAIEEGDIEALPAKTFVRGFVKSYAEMLKLDPAMVLSQFQEEMGTTRPVPKMSSIPAPAPNIEPPKSKSSYKLEETAAKQDLSSVTPNLKTNLNKNTLKLVALITFAVIVLGGINQIINKYQKEVSVAHEAPKLTVENLTQEANANKDAAAANATPAEPVTAPVESAPAPTTPSAGPLQAPVTQQKPVEVAPTEPKEPLAVEAATAAAKTVELVIEATRDTSISYTVGTDTTYKTLELKKNTFQIIKSKNGLHLKANEGNSISITVNGINKGLASTDARPVQLSFKNSFVLRVFLFSIFAKLVLAYVLPVVGDETYYFFWGQNLQLSYFDHPPAVAWLTWISNLIYQVLPLSWYWLSIRLPFIVLSSLTFIVWYKGFQIESTEADDDLFKYFSILYFLNPLTGPGGIFATPDVPLLFFWSVAYYAVLQIRKTQKTKWYSLLGVSLGLGFCSKYHIVLFPIAMIIGLAYLKELKSIQLKKLMITVLLGFVFSLPVIIWNYQHEWSLFAFQLNHGLNAKKSYDAVWTFGYIIGQIFLFNPIILFYLYRKTRNTLAKNVAFTQWIFFVYSSFKAIVEANWPITSHGQALLALKKDFKPYFKASLRYWIGLWAILLILMFTPVGEKKLIALPQSIAAKEVLYLTKDYRPLYGPTYQMTSLMHAISGETMYKLEGLSREDFYDSLKGSIPSEDNFYVLRYTETQDWPEWMLEECKIEKVLDIPKYQLELYRVSYE